MLIKVKEPLAQEVPKLREEQILFTYLHLAPLAELTDALLKREVTGIAMRPSPLVTVLCRFSLP
jgi:alanine dehydrogenase